MDVASLRRLVRPLVGDLKDEKTADGQADLCAKLGLPAPPDEEGLSKRERLHRSFDALSDDRVADVASRLLAQGRLRLNDRTALEELLWTASPRPPIPLRFRRELAKALAPDDLLEDVNAFDALIAAMFDLGDETRNPFERIDRSLHAEIRKHVYENPEDWAPELLFEKLGAYTCSEQRFARFVEGLASHLVRPDEPAQRAFVAQVNQAIRPCGAELRETAEDGGYPVFTLGTVGAKPAGRPKNIIFASTNKPDLRLVDAINNDIEIATRADEVLVYDEPIGSDGLLWRDLQRWWQERQRVVDETAAKRGLYDRLRSCLPDTSPPQRWLFEAFFKTFKDQVPRLPALLPEVWLHWDPKTMDARRAKREGTLPGHRMDFLLLLPHGGRVVVEVDGSHHFAEKDQRASPRKYAVMMAADRDLRLAGYEVFRFGAAELSSAEDTLTVAAPFFRRLFKANGIET